VKIIEMITAALICAVAFNFVAKIPSVAVLAFTVLCKK
jgi:hypothetical protein